MTGGEIFQNSAQGAAYLIVLCVVVVVIVRVGVAFLLLL